MLEVLLVIGGGLLSWWGSYQATKIHLEYLRRDVDLAHKRITDLQKAVKIVG